MLVPCRLAILARTGAPYLGVCGAHTLSAYIARLGRLGLLEITTQAMDEVETLRSYVCVYCVSVFLRMGAVGWARLCLEREYNNGGIRSDYMSLDNSLGVLSVGFRPVRGIL